MQKRQKMSLNLKEYQEELIQINLRKRVGKIEIKNCLEMLLINGEKMHLSNRQGMF